MDTHPLGPGLCLCSPTALGTTHPKTRPVYSIRVCWPTTEHILSMVRDSGSSCGLWQQQQVPCLSSFLSPAHYPRAEPLRTVISSRFCSTCWTTDSRSWKSLSSLIIFASNFRSSVLTLSKGNTELSSPGHWQGCLLQHVSLINWRNQPTRAHGWSSCLGEPHGGKDLQPLLLPVEGTDTIFSSSANQDKVQLACVCCLKQNTKGVFAALRFMDDKQLGTSSLGTRFSEW